ncbi:hypothetical protein AB4Y30_11890 [Ornithinibacillus sp. 4-3]|uniref:Antigen I/II N-terminal domain-containing protein n=1 Tax=Ornithinibacillus sp. 4-3 TaxID=3231488 RepID=A0AB39HK05_9BACI
MKKLLMLLIIALFVLAGCGKSGDVTITFPATMFDNELFTIDEMVEQMEEDNEVKEVNKNDDGSLSIVMSKSEHDKVMEEMKEDLQESFAGIVNDNEFFTSIKNIEENKDYTEINVTVDQAMYEEGMESFAMLALASSSVYYQIFSGIEADKHELTINLKDEASDEVFETMNYPEDFEDIGLIPE